MVCLLLVIRQQTGLTPVVELTVLAQFVIFLLLPTRKLSAATAEV